MTKQQFLAWLGIYSLPAIGLAAKSIWFAVTAELVLLSVAAAWWQWCQHRPPPFNLATGRNDTIDYYFRHADIASEFAALNWPQPGPLQPIL